MQTRGVEKIDADKVRRQLPRLLDRVADGETIVITIDGKPVARLVGLTGDQPARAGGHWRGLVRIDPEFNGPLPEAEDRAFRGLS